MQSPKRVSCSLRQDSERTSGGRVQLQLRRGVTDGRVGLDRKKSDNERNSIGASNRTFNRSRTGASEASDGDGFDRMRTTSEREGFDHMRTTSEREDAERMIGQPMSGNHRKTKITLKKAVTRLIHVQRVFRAAGVSIHHIDNRTLRFHEPVDNSEEFNTITFVMTHMPLMAKICELMKKFREAAQTSPRGQPRISDAEIDRLVGVATQLIFQIKFCTARTLWKEQLSTTQEGLAEMTDKYNFIRNQFNDMREQYLKEVIMLREEARVRPNPESQLDDSFDVKAFFDPTTTLTPPEASFAFTVITEKIKMIFETNPAVTKTIDFGQVQKLSELVETNRVREYQTALDKKTKELNDLKKYFQHSSRRSSLPQEPSKLSRNANIAETLLNNMQEKLRDMSLRCSELEREVEEGKQRSTKELEATTELQTLADSCRAWQERDYEAQQEIGQARAEIEEALQREQRNEAKVEGLEKQIRALEDTNRALARGIWRIGKVKEVGTSQDLLVVNHKRSEKVEAEDDANLKIDSSPGSPKRQLSFEDIVNSSENEVATAMMKRDEALARVAELEEQLCEAKQLMLSQAKENANLEVEKTLDRAHEAELIAVALSDEMNLDDAIVRMKSAVQELERSASANEDGTTPKTLTSDGTSPRNSPGKDFSLPRSCSYLKAMEDDLCSIRSDIEKCEKEIRQAMDKDLSGTKFFAELQQKMSTLLRQKLKMNVKLVGMRLRSAMEECANISKMDAQQQDSGTQSVACTCGARGLVDKFRGMLCLVLKLLSEVTAQLREVSSQNSELYEAMVGITDNVHEGMVALQKANADTGGDSIIDKAISKVKRLLPPAFSRLWKDALRRQAPKPLQKSGSSPVQRAHRPPMHSNTHNRVISFSERTETPFSLDATWPSLEEPELSRHFTDVEHAVVCERDESDKRVSESQAPTGLRTATIGPLEWQDSSGPVARVIRSASRQTTMDHGGLDPTSASTTNQVSREKPDFEVEKQASTRKYNKSNELKSSGQDLGVHSRSTPQASVGVVVQKGLRLSTQGNSSSKQGEVAIPRSPGKESDVAKQYRNSWSGGMTEASLLIQAFETGSSSLSGSLGPQTPTVLSPNSTNAPTSPPAQSRVGSTKLATPAKAPEKPVLPVAVQSIGVGQSGRNVCSSGSRQASPSRSPRPATTPGQPSPSRTGPKGIPTGGAESSAPSKKHSETLLHLEQSTFWADASAELAQGAEVGNGGLPGWTQVAPLGMQTVPQPARSPGIRGRRLTAPVVISTTNVSAGDAFEPEVQAIAGVGFNPGPALGTSSLEVEAAGTSKTRAASQPQPQASAAAAPVKLGRTGTPAGQQQSKEGSQQSIATTAASSTRQLVPLGVVSAAPKAAPASQISPPASTLKTAADVGAASGKNRNRRFSRQDKGSIVTAARLSIDGSAASAAPSREPSVGPPEAGREVDIAEKRSGPAKRGSNPAEASVHSSTEAKDGEDGQLALEKGSAADPLPMGWRPSSAGARISAPNEASSVAADVKHLNHACVDGVGLVAPAAPLAAKGTSQSSGSVAHPRVASEVSRGRDLDSGPEPLPADGVLSPTGLQQGHGSKRGHGGVASTRRASFPQPHLLPSVVQPSDSTSRQVSPRSRSHDPGNDPSQLPQLAGVGKANGGGGAISAGSKLSSP